MMSTDNIEVVRQHQMVVTQIKLTVEKLNKFDLEN